MAIQPKGKAAPSKEGTVHICGCSSYHRQQCPAKDDECQKSNKGGNYNDQYLSKSVGEVYDRTELLEDFAFLNTIGTEHDTSWTCTVTVNRQDILLTLGLKSQ